MKKLFRKILFAKSYLYIYPYSSSNLDNDLKRIIDTNYYSKKTILRGKKLNENQFSLWEKWNFFRGNYSYDALSFFSGTKYDQNNTTFIVGTTYPHPIFVLGFYIITMILFSKLFLSITETEIFKINIKEILLEGIICILLLTISLYFRWKIKKSVEHELKLKNAP